MKLLISIYNVVLRTGYNPLQWKVSQIILIPNQSKLLEEVIPYKPIRIEELEPIKTSIIMQDLEDKKYCPSAFLDISQVFYKVWHMVS